MDAVADQEGWGRSKAIGEALRLLFSEGARLAERRGIEPSRCGTVPMLPYKDERATKARAALRVESVCSGSLRTLGFMAIRHIESKLVREMATKQRLIVYQPVGRCIYCGSTEPPLGKEHIIPYGLGGPFIFPCKLQIMLWDNWSR